MRVWLTCSRRFFGGVRGCPGGERYVAPRRGSARGGLKLLKAAENCSKRRCPPFLAAHFEPPELGG
eukprot:2092901-Alexandrium_andersonii.AAC.1